MKMIGLVIVPLLGAFVLLQCAAFPIGDLAASTGSRANLEASERRGRRYTDAAAAAAAASGCLAKLELEDALEQVDLHNLEETREDEGGDGRAEWKRNSIPSGYIPVRGRRTSERNLDSPKIDDWGRPSIVSAATSRSRLPFLGLVSLSKEERSDGSTLL